MELLEAPSATRPWHRLKVAWKSRKTAYLAEQRGGTLASRLSAIETDRLRWAGTQRTICSQDELDDRYHIRDVLGSGAFGTVYRVIRVEDAEELAVKVIENSGSATEREEAVNECALWQQICSPYHPSILPLLEVVEVVGTETLHLFTPHMEWGNLCQALQDPDVERTEQAARLMMIQLTSAVAHLHGVHCIAHRDIKPENVLCEGADPTMAGCLKLCDFGCCQRFESLTERVESHKVVGTMNYVSPELAVAFLAADHTPAAFACPPTDCWALGAICYEIIEGRPRRLTQFMPSPICMHSMHELIRALLCVWRTQAAPPISSQKTGRTSWHASHHHSNPTTSSTPMPRLPTSPRPGSPS